MKHKKIFCYLFAVMLFFLLPLTSFAIARQTEEIISTSTMQIGNFVDNRILVVLNNTASMALSDYSPSDFSEINCKSVSNLTAISTALVEQKLASENNSMTASANASSTTVPAIRDIDLTTFNQILCLELEDSGNKHVWEAIEILKKRTDVLCVGPDYILSTSATTPNDTYYNQQWAPDVIQLPEAWDITKGTASTIVGVIDTAIEIGHPDLQNKVDINKSWDCLLNMPISAYASVGSDGHGTHVAGIIAATGNNSSGISGTAWNVKIASLKAFENGVGTSSDVIEAIEKAIAYGIPILNLSAGWYDDNVNYTDNNALYYKIQSYTGLFVCSAGNDTRNIDSYGTANDRWYYPACYNLSNIIVVGASNSSDRIHYTSNFGQTSVDIFAPGQNILSCYPTELCAHENTDSTHLANGYHYMSGTSMAAPYVAGVAALILSKYPNLSTAAVKARILNNAEIVTYSSGTSVFLGRCVTGGRLNAYYALTNSTG